MSQIVALTPDRFNDFIALVCALADYEQLERPSADAIERLRHDAFSERPRYEAFLRLDDSNNAVGYAIIFETYSSFLALPTMYLEDLFVLPESRQHGHGKALFEHVRALAHERGCGRMDWTVLDWNQLAREFYHRSGAMHLTEWLLYRLEPPVKK